MRWMKWIGLVLLAGVVGLGIWLWDPLPKAPSTAELSAAAADYDAEIIRDNWGVPHIFGARDRDTSFGLGYAHAEDDFATIQEVVAATRGSMARYRGADAASTDYIVALFDVWGTIEERYERDVPEDVKAIAEAYVAGVNLYAAENPGEVWAGLAPFTAEDVIAGFVFKTPLFYGLDGTLLALFGDDYVQEIALDPAPGREAWNVGPRTLAERGSNAIAVAPHRSGDSTTRLLINSHQPMTGPVAWYEAHTVSEEGLDMMGALFPGTPVVLQGTNPDLGWANTVSEQDLADVYVLERNPDNEMQYKLDGTWKDLEVSSVTIRVRLFGPFAIKAKRQVLRSVHGPVIEATHGTYAIRYAGMGEIRQLEQYYRLGKTRSLVEFEDAMSMLALPSINYVYADREGNIGFFHNGQYPNRNNDWDWSGDLPGDRSELVWQGYRPWSEVPKLVNPVSGLVWNSNNTPYTTTDGPDNMAPEDFPQSMGLQTNQTNRGLRMLELTDGERLIDRTELLRIKFDTQYAQDSEADHVVKAVLSEDWCDAEVKYKDAVTHLAAWDYRMDVDSRHAALGGMTVMWKVTERYTDITAPAPADAFRQTVDYLLEHYGRIDPEWGEVNRLVRGDVNVPIGGAPDTLRAIYPAEPDADGILESRAGDTWIGLVEWQADGTRSAEVIHQFGAATLVEGSPHYADQAALFAEQKWRKALLTRAEIEANAERRYRPGKAETAPPDTSSIQ